MLRAFTKTTVVELKLFLREPAAAFFTLVLPLLLLMLNGQAGNEPSERFGGASPLEVLLPGYVALVIATFGLSVLPEGLAQDRETGVLRRKRATPLRPPVILAAYVTLALIVTAIGLALLLTVAVTAYDMDPPSDPLGVGVALLLSALSFYAVSFLLAGLLPSARTTTAVASALYFPMIFCSGATFPREVLPEFAQQIGRAMPLTYAVEALRGPWTGTGWSPAALAVLAVLLVVAVAVSSRTFRWE